MYFPRTAMEDASKRKIAKYTGVYFLFGRDNNGENKAHIGEEEDCFTRIQSHNQNKDFCRDCVVVSSKTNDYNKADSKFLGYYCIEKLKK